MNFLSQYMRRFGPNMADEGGFMRQLPGFQAHTGGPGQMQGVPDVYTGGGLQPMPQGMPTMHPNIGLPPLTANTGGGLPAMLSGFHAGTGGYDAPSQFHANTGGGMPPQAQGFGLRGLMDFGRRMGGRSY